jgi:hypothetical protein
VIALVFTSLLAIAGYMVQSKNAADADRAQHEIVQEAADRDQTRGLAAIQLERVRNQMGEVYRPVQVLLNQADACAVYMQHELGFEFNDVWGLEFVRPFSLWPHIEVFSRDYIPKTTVARKGSPYKKYSPADLALLEDPTKRQIYIDAHIGCLAPRYREVAAILSTKSALMEPPLLSYLDGVFPADGVDWTKFSSGTLSVHMFDMAMFAYAWAPLERRWEMDGAAAIMHYPRAHYAIVLPKPWMEAGRLTLVDSTCRLLPDAAHAAEPVAHRELDLQQDDQHDRREGDGAPGHFERRCPREHVARGHGGGDVSPQ